MTALHLQSVRMLYVTRCGLADVLDVGRKIHKFTEDDLDDGKPRRLSFANGAKTYISRGTGVLAPSTSRLPASTSRNGPLDASRLAYQPSVGVSLSP